jgi:DNA (cytosine-5)-methyltransferase 1
MRMLQVPELKEAMGFPVDFRLSRGTRRDRIKLLGNAVCPPVMKSIVEALVRQTITEAIGNTQAATPPFKVVSAKRPELSLAQHA